MKKVVYSVYRIGKANSKMSGIGYVVNKDLLTACVGQNGKPYIKVFEECLEDLRLVSGTKNEQKDAL